MDAKECSNYRAIALISHASKIMLKILQTKVSAVCELRMSRCRNWILKKQRNQRSNCQHPLDHQKPTEIQKNIYFCFIDYTKAKLWKILKEMGIPNHLTCLLRNLYAGQEATVRAGHGETGLFKIRKGVHQGCILSPCLFNLDAKYIMGDVRLDESQAGIKIAGKNINNLRYADDYHSNGKK